MLPTQQVPEVGLELHSTPCKHWEVAERCGIRADPIDLQPNPKPKVGTLSTLPFCPIDVTLEIGRAPPSRGSRAHITGSKLDFAGSLWMAVSALHLMLQTAEVQFNFAAVNAHHHLCVFYSRP